MATNGVAMAATRGKKDTWPYSLPCQIVINGNLTASFGWQVTYDQISALAGYADRVISITWAVRGVPGRDGILSPGSRIDLVPGMYFTAIPTGNA